jgi:hypothetical protein
MEALKQLLQLSNGSSGMVINAIQIPHPYDCRKASLNEDESTSLATQGRDGRPVQDPRKIIAKQRQAPFMTPKVLGP